MSTPASVVATPTPTHFTPLGRAVRSKGERAFLRRLGLILTRFGPGPGRLARAMARYAGVLAEASAPATWAVTVDAAERHPEVLRPYRESRIELALHGWRHTDHESQPPSSQQVEVDAAVERFRRLGFRFEGWRSPYLRAGEATLVRLASLQLAWDASQTVLIPATVPELGRDARLAWARAVDFYHSPEYAARLALPSLDRGVVRFPTALPDDEMLFDRLGLPEAAVGAAWLSMLHRTRLDGELMVLQLHPERAILAAAALRLILAAARAARPAIWIATLGELADWWRQRAECHLEIQRDGEGWHVAVAGGGACLVERLTPARGVGEAPGERRPAVDFVDRRWPGVGVAGRNAVATLAALANAGLAAQLRNDGVEYAVEVRDPSPVELAALVRRVAAGRELAGPVARLARWPDNYHSALAVTGDICALTLHDFARRLWEVR